MSMRNRVFGSQLSRDTDTRKALFRSLVAAVVKNDKIVTTKAKAKSVQGFIDKLAKMVQENTLASRRRVFAKLGNDKVTTEKLFGVYRSVFGERKSGFTRITSLYRRKGDMSKMVRLEFVDKPVSKTKPAGVKTKVGLARPAVKEKKNENTPTK